MMKLFINSLSDAYSIQHTPTTFEESIATSKHKIFIENSKLFICRLNKSSLNSNRFTSQLKLAIRLLKPTFILLDSQNVNIEDIEISGKCKVFNTFTWSDTHLLSYIDLFLK